jgi:hypothetical protein
MSSDPVGAARPRVLVHGLTPSEVDIVRSLAGSVRITEDFGDVHPEEHDAVIQTGADFFSGLSGNYPRRLAFAPKPSLDPRGIAGSSGSFGHSESRPMTKAQTRQTPARDFDVPDSVKGMGLETLVRASCQPLPEQRYVGVHTPVFPERETVILLQERLKHGLALAGVFRSKESFYSSDFVVWLPDQARSHLKDWLKHALSLWREDEPDRFPIAGDWHIDDAWASIPELDSRRRLADFDAEERRRLELSAMQRQVLADQVEADEVEGAVWRSLLTLKGDDLVRQVQSALESFAFVVVDSDALPENKGKKREDLRVIDGAWTALVEVKGYAGSAKSGDLLQVTSTVGAYAAAKGREPDALWYVPNVERDLSPDQRATPLAAREDDLHAFAEAHHGCLIDTRELFILRQMVATGALTQERARELLKQATGRFQAGAVTATQ